MTALKPRSQPYRIDWNTPATTIEELNTRLGQQAQNIDYMFQILFEATKAVSSGSGIGGYAAHGVLVGEGSSPISTVGPGSTHTVLHGEGPSADPVFSPIVAGDLTISGVTPAELTFADGTAAAPSITFTSDTSKGIYSPGTNQIGIAAQGAEVAAFGPNTVDTLVPTSLTLYDSGFVYTGPSENQGGDGIILKQTTAATAAIPQQWAPRLNYIGHAWNTGSAADNIQSMLISFEPFSGNPPGGYLKVDFRNVTTGTHYGPVFSVDEAGDVIATGSLTAGAVAADGIGGGSSGFFKASNAGGLYWATRSIFESPADGKSNFTNNAISAGIGLDYATDGTLKIRNRAQSADGQLSAASVRGNAVTVANLPATPVEGMIVAVLDATVTTTGTIVVGGGGHQDLVWYDGTNWIIILGT